MPTRQLAPLLATVLCHLHANTNSTYVATVHVSYGIFRVANILKFNESKTWKKYENRQVTLTRKEGTRWYTHKKNPTSFSTSEIILWENHDPLNSVRTWWISGNPYALERTISFKFPLQFWLWSARPQITDIDTSYVASTRHNASKVICLLALVALQPSILNTGIPYSL